MKYDSIERVDEVDDELVFIVQLSNPEPELEKWKNEIDTIHKEAGEGCFYMYVNYSNEDDQFSCEGTVYQDGDSNEHWFEYEVSTELMNEIIQACKEVLREAKEIEELEEYSDCPELLEYEETDDGYKLYLDRSNDDTPIEDLGRYEVIFDLNDNRYYCYMDAINMNEALGIFFRYHPHITYEQIIEHLEV